MEQNESTKDIVSEINKWNDVNKIINVPSYIPAQYGLYKAFAIHRTIGINPSQMA